MTRISEIGKIFLICHTYGKRPLQEKKPAPQNHAWFILWRITKMFSYSPITQNEVEFCENTKKNRLKTFMPKKPTNIILSLRLGFASKHLENLSEKHFLWKIMFHTFSIVTSSADETRSHLITHPVTWVESCGISRLLDTQPNRFRRVNVCKWRTQ